MQYIQMLARYKAWADDLFLTAVSSVPEVELTAPRPIVFGSLLRTLNHVHAMDYVWQCHLQGKPHGLTTRNPEHNESGVRFTFDEDANEPDPALAL